MPKYRRAMLPLTGPLPSSTWRRGRARTPLGCAVVVPVGVAGGEDSVVETLGTGRVDAGSVSDVAVVDDEMELLLLFVSSRSLPMTAGLAETAVRLPLRERTETARALTAFVSVTCREDCGVESDGSIVKECVCPCLFSMPERTRPGMRTE